MFCLFQKDNFERGKKQICQMMTIYLVWLHRINFSKALSVLTATLIFITSKHLLKISSLRKIT